MLCENCHQREATVRFTQVLGSEKKNLNLCNTCAEKQQFDNHLVDISKIFGKIIIAMLSEHIVTKTPDVSDEKIEGEKCGQCGITWKHFEKTGRLGCADCYESFMDPLKVLLRRLHGTNRHIGPNLKESIKHTSGSVQALKKKLQSAIKKEDYEKAAELRDQIREYEALKREK